MFLIVGDRLRHSLTGKVYQLKKIVDEWVLLEEETIKNQVLTGFMDMVDSYEKLDRFARRDPSPTDQINDGPSMERRFHESLMR